MKSKNNNQASAELIHPLIKVIFIISIIIFICTTFVNNWTSSSPTLFAPDSLTPAFNNLEDDIQSKLNDNASAKDAAPSFTSPQKRNESNKSNHSSKFIHSDSESTSHQQKTFPIKNTLPEFLQAPTQPFELLLPIISVAYICLILRFIPSNNWTRLIVRSIILILSNF